MSFDYAACFTSLSPATAPVPAAVVSIQGVLLSSRVMGGSITLRLRVSTVDGPQIKLQQQEDIFVSLPLCDAPADLPVLSELKLDNCTASATTSDDGRTFWRASGPPTLLRSSQQIIAAVPSMMLPPLPLPASGKGRPFVLSSERVAMERCPGVLHGEGRWNHQKLTRMNRNTEKEECCLEVSFDVYHWDTTEELQSGPQLIPMRLMLWNDQCLLMSSPDAWKALMTAHRVPFYATCCVNADYKLVNGGVSVSAIGVHWELAAYLQAHCPSVSRAEAITLLKAAARRPSAVSSPSSSVIVNVSCAGRLPRSIDDQWRFYAMTNPRLPASVGMAELQRALVVELFAIKVTAPPPFSSSSPPSPSPPPPPPPRGVTKARKVKKAKIVEGDDNDD